MSFKLLAIRPLEGCDKKYLKNLQKGCIYRFYNNYKYYNDKGDIVSGNEDVYRIYSDKFHIDNLYKTGDINVHISAIVGKNGSGKTAITELFLYSIFRILNHIGDIPEYKHEDKSNIIPEPEEYTYQIGFNKDVENIKKSLRVELYYTLDNKLFIISINEMYINIHECIKESNYWTIDKKKEEWEKIVYKIDYIKDFFYTVLVNYSLYSFNSNEIGNWIGSFFHKNDGYQIPIVINPYRDEGNIEVNNEKVLTRNRLLTNILTLDRYEINEKSEIDKIELHYNNRKDYKLSFSDEFITKFKDKILIPLFNKTFNDKFEYPQITSSLEQYVEKYLIHKIITIPTKYKKSFGEFDYYIKSINTDYYNLDKVDDATKFINALVEDNSHITLKVRQTLNFLRINIYTDIIKSNGFNHTWEIDKLREKFIGYLEEIKNENWFTEPIDYLPPSCFFCGIGFKNLSTFEQLSSGEKQKIYSLNSIIYHIRNIDSVHKKGKVKNEKKGLIAYNNVNLILDEIELYYHPEFQRKTISDLLFLIEKANFDYIKNINIILITHSPFILSDIPNSNILRLDDGEIQEMNDRTLGANIHDLLANDFFMENGFMGEWAKNMIISAIEYLNSKIMESEINNNSQYIWNKENLKYFINQLGEPLIKNSLNDLYNEAFKL